MRGMILAAGRGKRMGPLTADTPKPLLKLGQHYLIEYAIYALAKIGIKEIVINVCYLAEKIKAVLGQGQKYGVFIYYSEEKEALETGGGIVKALPYLGKQPFIVLSGDVICNYPLQQLKLPAGSLGHLVLVDNPDFNPTGDFYLKESRVVLQGEQALTYGNIGIYHPELFSGHIEDKFPLVHLLRKAAFTNKLTGEYYPGFWHNLGTPLQLQALCAAPDSLPINLL